MGATMDQKRIVIVEDNELNLKLAQTLLELEGYESIPAANAETGLQLIREHQPDLVLMDIQLPGMDGLTATRYLKAETDTEAIPVVALSAHAMNQERQMALDAGCCGYITKPYDIKTFLGDVSGYLKRGLCEPAYSFPSSRP